MFVCHNNNSNTFESLDNLRQILGDICVIILQEVAFVTLLDLLPFSSFSDIPGASRIKNCATGNSRIKTLNESYCHG